MRKVWSCLFALVVGAFISGAIAQERDSAGNGRYLFILKVDMTHADPVLGQAAARLASDPANKADRLGWHRPAVRALIRELEGEYGVKPLAVTSWAMPAFSAYVSDSLLEKLGKDSRIEEVLPISRGNSTFSWSDSTSGNEQISWGLDATGTNDGINFSTGYRVYILDGGAAANSDVNIDFAPFHLPFGQYQCTQLGCADCSAINTPHATHVAGIIGAKVNNSLVRGAMPNITVANVNACFGGAFTEDWIAESFDWVL